MVTTLNERVALLGGDRHEWVEAWCAMGGIGGVSVPINWHFSVDEIAYVIEDSGATALVADADDEKAAAAAELAGVGTCIAFGGPIDGFIDFEKIITASSADEPKYWDATGRSI